MTYLSHLIVIKRDDILSLLLLRVGEESSLGCSNCHQAGSCWFEGCICCHWGRYAVVPRGSCCDKGSSDVPTCESSSHGRSLERKTAIWALCVAVGIAMVKLGVVGTVGQGEGCDTGRHEADRTVIGAILFCRSGAGGEWSWGCGTMRMAPEWEGWAASCLRGDGQSWSHSVDDAFRDEEKEWEMKVDVGYFLFFLEKCSGDQQMK